jgi:hypothetical protein
VLEDTLQACYYHVSLQNNPEIPQGIQIVDPDLLTVALLLFIVIFALLVPPGPGTPLSMPVR